MDRGHIIRTGDIFKLTEPYEHDGGESRFCRICFPIGEDEKPTKNDYYLLDALPCDENGIPAKGYEYGMPMHTSEMGEFYGNYYDD